MLAKTYTFVSGIGKGKTKLDAFDSALLDAGIGNLNLVKVSSILPPSCTYCATPKWIDGQIVYCVYACNISNNKYEIISVAVGVAKPKQKNLPGIIMKCSGNGHSKMNERVVRELCHMGMRRRLIKDYEIRIRSKECIVKNFYSSVFVGVILNE